MEMNRSLMRSERRRRLADLDGLLNELEWLNLSNCIEVPVELASRLEMQGVGAPSKKIPSELIEDVFELQRPFLRPNPSAAKPNAVPIARQPVMAEWLSF